ncbi:packaged DNA stabilization gp4 family protein [Gilvimarinus chinensis]|uniref:packaged DNA stabilization gp4 family protein n=1 Tax=Gilvimarinus chinensis TaxID=396005 RepID=UPI00037C78CA|nr:packaged DNA stabilization gp4 family protein [Gilvimarinus chinensis]
MKASELIGDALGKLGVRAANQPVEPDDFAVAVRECNRMFGTFAYLELGYTPLEHNSDDVTIPDYAQEWAVLELALRLAPDFAPAEDYALLKDRLRIAKQDMLLQNQTIEPMSYPPTLPTGSGNTGVGRLYDPTFYPGPEEE